MKLGDLGLSKGLSEIGTATQVGTANFMAPEIVFGLDYDFKVDCWSLGSLFFEFVTGYPIMGFYNPELRSFEEKLDDGYWYLPSEAELSVEGLDFIHRCLQFDPC